MLIIYSSGNCKDFDWSSYINYYSSLIVLLGVSMSYTIVLMLAKLLALSDPVFTNDLLRVLLFGLPWCI